MDVKALEPLEWDEHEEATIPSMRPPEGATIRRSAQGWLVITNEWDKEPRSAELQRDTIVSESPPTERSEHPPSTASPTTRQPSTTTPTTRRKPAPPPRKRAIEIDVDIADVEIVDERTTRHSEVPDTQLSESAPPESTVRHSEIRPVSLPIPLVRDPVGERETRHRLSSIDLDAATRPLEAQVAQLRRWLMVSLLLASVATVTAAVAVIYSLGGPDNVFPNGALPEIELPQMGGAKATRANNPRVVGTRLQGVAKSEPVEKKAPVAAAPEAEPKADVSPDGKVGVTIALLAPRATISLTQFGSNQRMVHGPYPKTVRLEPGVYTLTAYRPGFPIFQKQLDLSLDRPKREVAISW